MIIAPIYCIMPYERQKRKLYNCSDKSKKSGAEFKMFLDNETKKLEEEDKNKR